ncbi:MAG: GNAT family N-acetyltransferase [Chloroflexota bacterium]
MTIEIQRFSADDIGAHKDEFIQLLRDVVDGGSSVNFIAPLDLEIAAAFWERIAGEAAANTRIVVTALEANRVVGCVHLVLAMQPNGRYRAEVQKVLVHSRARRRGIATLLMRAIEDEARAVGRTVLVLDTEQGSGAEKLYEQIGYTRVGVFPQFALNSDGSAFISAVFFYKLLE